MEITHEQDGQESRLSDIVAQVKDAIRRRWKTLLAVAAVVFAIGVAGIFMMTPKYTSLARVQLDPTRNPLATDAGASVDTLAPEAIETEISLISSQDVARDVVRRLKLDRDPFFAEMLDAGPAPHPTGDDRTKAVADILLGGLAVNRERLSFILDIRYTSKNPEVAARVANGFAQAYIETKTGNKANTAQRQADFFKQRLDALGREANSTAAAAAQYRAQAGIVQGAGGSVGTITDQQIAPLSSQLATAQAEAAAAHAKLSAAQRQIASGGLDSISEVLGSGVIANLRSQRATTQRAVEEVQARYGDRHPESIRVHDQLESIDKQIDAEARRVVASLQASANAADASVGSLRSSMGRLEGEQASNTRAAVMADTLQREAEAKRAAYDKMSQLSLSSTEGAKNMIAQAEIVEMAQPLTAPTSPNKPLLMALAFAVALAVGAAVITVQEMMITGLSTIDDVQKKLGMRVLAAIPKLPRSIEAADMLLDRPTSLFAESLRIARAAILGVRSQARPKVIAITSALPAEGKTTTALSFARTLANNKAKTLLIECDVRRAAMNPLVKTDHRGPGIVEVLHGEATLAQAIHPGDVPGLDHFLVSAPYFSSEDLFGGGNFESLLTELRDRYEQIVLDLPPLVGLADGRFLAVLADATVIVLRWNTTPADAVLSSIDWLRSDGANPVGIIYSMVDTNAEAIGGLYYSKKYAGYYQPA